MFKQHFYRNAHIPSIKNILSSNLRQTAELFQMEAELHILQEDSRKYLNNPFLGYLNITSVRNKNNRSLNSHTKFASRLLCSKRV